MHDVAPEDEDEPWPQAAQSADEVDPLIALDVPALHSEQAQFTRQLVPIEVQLP